MCFQVSFWIEKRRRNNIKVHLVLRTGHLYPVNWLRNLLILKAQTEYILSIDADFLPNKNLLSDILKEFAKIESTNSGQKTAVIVPAFEIFSNDVTFPATKRDVTLLEGQGHVDVFHRKWHPDGHRIWLYNTWKNARDSYSLRKESICSEPEPYIAVRRSQSPYFPETLLERGKNKVAYHFEMCIADFRFVVLADGFLVHKPHTEASKASARVDRCVTQAWSQYQTHLAHAHKKTALYRSNVPGFIYNILYILLCLVIELLWFVWLLAPFLAFITGRRCWFLMRSKLDYKVHVHKV